MPARNLALELHMQTVGHGNDDSSKSPKVLSPSHDEGRCN